jgi:hypothetical protein
MLPCQRVIVEVAAEIPPDKNGAHSGKAGLTRRHMLVNVESAVYAPC